MVFGLKNVPGEFQNIMSDIFNSFTYFSIAYINNFLIFSKSIDEYWKHLSLFLYIIRQNGLIISTKKVKLFQIKIRFISYDIFQSKIRPINRAIKFNDKFSNIILDQNQL